MSDPFADIRPYHDNEVEAVIHRLLGDAEFVATLAQIRLPGLHRFAPWLARPLVAFALRRQLASVRDVYAVQMQIKTYVEAMIEDRTAGFSVTGLEKLPGDRACLFISNHRDIAMDPAFTNYALHRAGHDTVRIAIGDNLLTKPWVSDLMRLNKSFIVQRSARGPRELLAAAKNLSGYIHHSLTVDNAPVWIAQREGRAKDGVDRTEPAIIKMLTLARDRKQQSFAAYIRELRIVPVSISYELDPCDAAKARELAHLAAHGSYQKDEHEDVESIGLGISGQKGRVHVSFGTPLVDDFETPESVAAEIDRQVVRDFCVHPTNIRAYHRLHGAQAPLPEGLYLEDGSIDDTDFDARIDALPEAERPYALAIYANAVTSKLTRSEAAGDGSRDGA